MIPRQCDVLDWAVENFGEVARNVDERAARLVEEAIEVAQHAGVPTYVIERIMRRVYSRPVGDLGQELGGVGIALMAVAENSGLGFQTEILKEWDRVQALPKEHWQRKHAEKVAAGTADLSPVK